MSEQASEPPKKEPFYIRGNNPSYCYMPYDGWTEPKFLGQYVLLSNMTIKLYSVGKTCIDEIEVVL